MQNPRTLATALIACFLVINSGLSASPRALVVVDRTNATDPIPADFAHCPDYFFEADDCEEVPLQDLRAELRSQGKTLAVVIGDYEKLRRFGSLIEASGLLREIEAAGPFTIFAPTDQAILAANLGSLGLQSDPGAREKLRQTIADHIVAGEINWEQLAGRRSELTSLSGSKILVDGRSGIRIGRSRITDSDVLAANGVMHIVDAVISDQRQRAPGV